MLVVFPVVDSDLVVCFEVLTAMLAKCSFKDIGLDEAIRMQTPGPILQHSKCPRKHLCMRHFKQELGMFRGVVLQNESQDLYHD